MILLRWAALVLLTAAGSAAFVTVTGVALASSRAHDLDGHAYAQAPSLYGIAFVAILIFLLVFALPATLFHRRTGLPRWPYYLGIGAVVGGVALLPFVASDDSWRFPAAGVALGMLCASLWLLLERMLLPAGAPHPPGD